MNMARVQCEPRLLWHQDIRVFLTALSSQSHLIDLREDDVKMYFRIAGAVGFYSSVLTIFFSRC